jgi:hypothetical protein
MIALKAQAHRYAVQGRSVVDEHRRSSSANGTLSLPTAQARTADELTARLLRAVGGVGPRSCWSRGRRP